MVYRSASEDEAMPRMGEAAVTIRLELVRLAQQGELSVRELCRRFRISAPPGDKWLARFSAEGAGGLKHRSHRPHHQPQRSSAELEALVMAVRQRHPVWGGRKIRKVLAREGAPWRPSASTVSAILRRHGRLAPALRPQHALRHFEHQEPNELWQMDFKGDFALERGRCHPLTVLDDHSRFALALAACANQREATVRERLGSIFRIYGLPRRMLADNGPPFGTSGQEAFSTLEVWLMRLGIELRHGRPRHPQTQGKDERFHRTLKLEVRRNQQLRDLRHAQREFDRWREIYNHQRPHQALGLEVPASRYRPSPRPFPELLPHLDSAPDLIVRKVQRDAEIYFARRQFKIGKAFIGPPVALRPTTTDGVCTVLFNNTEIRRLALRRAQTNP
jgi:transposase InsO family protein